MDNNWGKLKYSREKPFPVPLFPPQVTMTGIKINGESVANNCLYHGTAVILCSVCTVLTWHTQEQLYLYFTFMDYLTHH
jgi:hypothetical protein